MKTSVVVAVLVAALAAAPHATGSCAPASDGELAARAEAVFEAEALPGPVAFRGDLVGPARFRVTRYLKGSGPDEVFVETGAMPAGSGYRGTSVSIEPRAGERWRIFTPSGIGGIVLTTTCDGSGVIANAAGPYPWPARSYDPEFPWQGVATVSSAVAIGAALGLGIVAARRRLGDQGLSP